MREIRTDLALEAKELFEESAGKTTALPGVKARTYRCSGCRVTAVEVLDRQGSAALGKPVGRYFTLELPAAESSFAAAVHCIAGELRRLLPPMEGRPALVVGLGNRAVTPDALGPLAVEQVLPTRHLKNASGAPLAALTSVCTLTPGVLGTTGMESAEVVQGVARRLRPGCVIVIDALMARRTGRLCTTVQLSDTGIVPGSGVGNHRCALTEETLQVPVLSVGVPMVIDAATLAADLLEDRGDARAQKRPEGLLPGMVVTVKDVDARVHALAKSVAWGIDLALHPALTPEDLAALLA